MTDTLDSHQYAYQVADNTEWVESRDATLWQRLNRLWFRGAVSANNSVPVAYPWAYGV
ncbi:TPA: hypothetical protein LVL12_005111 [Klebsiella oxytoca]|nr:hypothetical protein [Klebsiella oxytoca]